MSFVREAWPFVLPPAIIGVLLFFVGQTPWAWSALFLAFLILLFFRNPKRAFSGDATVVLAPADGRILRVDEVVVAELEDQPMRRIVTFLSVFNVHVQRCPVGGEVTSTEYREGAKVPAFNENAGEVNQQNLTVIHSTQGDLIGIRQIAGLVARRVVGYLERGDVVERGELLGVIKFGSRVDLLVPMSYMIEVAVGDRVKTGVTPMARKQ
jgi:phosphatidylserine decarboxylase